MLSFGQLKIHFRRKHSMKKLQEMKERLLAIAEFATESAETIDELLNQEGTAKEAPKTAPKVAAVSKAKPAETEDDPLATIIKEYGLNEMSLQDLKDALNEAGVEYNKKVKDASKLVPVVAQAIFEGAIGGDDDDSDDNEPAKEAVPVDEDEEPTEPTQEEFDAIVKDYELNEMEIEDIKEYLTSYEIEFPAKAKRPSLIKLFVQAIFDGTIPSEEGEAEDATEDAEDAPDSDEGEEDNESDVELSEATQKAEKKVRSDIAKQIKSGKLTVKKMKDTLKGYYEGDENCSDCKGCTDEEVIECYSDIHAALVDDEGTVNEFSNPYLRGEVPHCCGVPLATLESGNLYCEICGEEYNDEE
jgi:hypothetical protein